MVVWNDALREEVVATTKGCEERRGVFLLDYTKGLTNDGVEESSEKGCDFVLKTEFNADFTHMNSAFLPLLEHALLNCGCNLDLI